MTVPLSTLDATGGDDLGSSDVGGNLRQLSVAEIQQALRELRTQRPRPAAAAIGPQSQRPEDRDGRQAVLMSGPVPMARRPITARADTPAQDRGDTAKLAPARGGDSAIDSSQGGGDRAEPATGWIAVVAAHAGAGASTVALAISDAAAVAGRRVHLVDRSHPSRSGLLAATSEELGTDVTGAWRRGLRTGVIMDRRATDMAPDDWPVPPVGEGPALTVVDLGLAAAGSPARLAADRSRLVVVCRPTVPGVRLTEQLLDQLAQQPVAVAAVGPSRWPGAVTASSGPRLRVLRAAGRVVPVPMDRRFQITGPTSSPLPRPIRSAGRSLLGLLDDGHPSRAARPSAATTNAVPTLEGTRR